MHGEGNGPAVPRPDVASAGGAPGGAGMSGYAPIRDQFLRFGDLRPQARASGAARFRCRRWPSSTPKSGRWAPWSMSMSARWA